MDKPLLQVRDLKVHVGSSQRPVCPVDEVSFDIHAGETLALLGESGCGKSMTALALLRLLPQPTGKIISGSVVLQGENLMDRTESGMRAIRGSRIAMIFQEPNTSLNPVMTVGYQIEESLLQHKGLKGSEAKGCVLELLDQVGIPDAGRRYGEYPHQLSGGMKQRVMIAIALAGDPELLVADEPTTALDVTIQAQVLDLIKKLQQERGMAVLLITHDLGVVSEMADRVAVMYAGQIVEQSSRDEFFSEPMHPYSQKLFEALPDHSKRDQKLSVIKGSVPPLDQTFEHCRFAERCEQSWGLCISEAPGWDVIAHDRGLRCFLSDASLSPDRDDRESTNISETVVADALTNTKSFDEHDAKLLEVDSLKIHFPIHKGLFKRVVGQVKAVDGINVSIPRGETLALVGESGCGKTTVGKGILQLLRNTAGSVRFEEVELTGLKGEALRKRRSDFQIIFQDPFSSMNPRMTVSNIIQEGMIAQNVGGNASAREKRVAVLLEQVGMRPEHASRYPHEFSGGQRQRICIARALAVEPKLIICDEPTSALDVSVQAQILNLLQELQRTLGLSYLFITHDLSVVSYLADRVAVMYLGRIVEEGSTQEVLENPQHPYTQALLSAIPQIDKDKQRTVIRLEGDLPSPANQPDGCHFHPRCPSAQPNCTLTYPSQKILSDTRKISCHLV